MRTLAAQFASHLSTRRPGNVQFRNVSTQSTKEAEAEFEQEAEKKIGWLLKLIFAGTATAVAYQFFPYMDERRMKIIEMGGDKELVNMLETAKDDRTRKAALKALSAISQSDKAVGALRQAGAISVLKAIPDNFEDEEMKKFKAILVKRFHDLKDDGSYN